MNGDLPEDLELTFVPPDQREAVRNFDEEAEAELAAGFLRAQGIAAEVGAMIIPGLHTNLSLWVYKRSAAEARRLLDEADARANGPQPIE